MPVIEILIGIAVLIIMYWVVTIRLKPSPYDQGVEAFEAGRSTNVNPYKAFVQKRQFMAWRAGWTESKYKSSSLSGGDHRRSWHNG